MSLENKTPEEIAALAALADDVLSKPDTAGVFQRLIKRNNPNVSMPMVELEDKTAAAFKAHADHIDRLNGRLAQQDAEKAAGALYESMREHGSVRTRDEFSDLVKYASENGFVANETGLRKAAMMRQSEREAAEPTPTTFGAGGFSIGEGEDAKQFMANPLGHARTVAMRAMDDLRKLRAKGGQAH